MSQKKRIASLLPSSTEICFALGLGERVVGVSHECDFPDSARGRPILTRSTVDATASSAEIDRQVRERTTRGLSLYDIEEERLRELAPDLIVTQDTCQVCAVSFAAVEEATARLLGRDTQIVSLSPMNLEDVLEDFARVGRAAGVAERASALIAEHRERLAKLAARTAELPRPRVLALEWMNPPMVIGHWSPELIRLAGGEPVLGHDGAPTRATTWEEIAAADPEVILLLPCGFEVEQTLRDFPALLETPGFRSLSAVAARRVTILDGNAFFNRPGPRLAESAELAALAIHPEALCDVVDTTAPAMGKKPIHVPSLLL